MKLLHRHDGDHDRHDGDGDGNGDIRQSDRYAERPVFVPTRGEAEDRDLAMIGSDAAHRSFGGVDFPATIAGTMGGLGMLVVVGGIMAGAGTVAYEGGASETELTTGSVIAGLAALFIAFLFGGWVAGRTARYDGARNGFLSGLWFVLLSAALGGLGAWLGDRYDVFQELELPSWFSGGELTGDDQGEAIVVGAVAIAAVLLGGILGGLLGVRYHRRADAVVEGTTPVVVERDRRDIDLRDERYERDRAARRMDPAVTASDQPEPPPPPPPAERPGERIVRPG